MNTFAAMSTPNKKLIRREILNCYTLALRSTRKRIKGLRISYLVPLDILGTFPEGARNFELSKARNVCPQSTEDLYGRLINAGLVRKVGKLYYLTDRGRIVVDEMENSFDINRIISLLSELT